jgi:hypothetical protein
VEKYCTARQATNDNMAHAHWMLNTYGSKRTLRICITWYDMIWYDMIWYDMIWYDMIWYDMIWYDMIRYDMIYDMIWYDMIWYDIWYDMIWYDMIWYDIFVNCNWLATRWQLCSTHLHINNTQNDTKQTILRTTLKFWKSAGRAPTWLVIPCHLSYNWVKSMEKLQSG